MPKDYDGDGSAATCRCRGDGHRFSIFSRVALNLFNPRMGLRTRARRVGRALASRHFFGGRSGPIFRTARALDALLARAGRRSTAPR